MSDLHQYDVTVTWTGNTGYGTSGYRDYGRDFTLVAENKQLIEGSADPTFRGTASRWNPEDMLLAALSACHKLSYLHLCAVNRVVVTAYEDHARGFMRYDAHTGIGRFERVVLRPEVTVTRASDGAKAAELHHEAHKLCFIANSVNFPVECEPLTTLEPQTTPETASVGH